MRSALLVIVPGLVVAALACADPGATAPRPPGDRPFLTGGSCGGYSPTSASILVDSIAIFVRDSFSVGGCDTRYGEITPASGIAGFSQGSVCSQTTSSGTLLFKVRGCARGTVSLKIYTNSSKTTLLQTIPIDVDVQ